MASLMSRKPCLVLFLQGPPLPCPLRLILGLFFCFAIVWSSHFSGLSSRITFSESLPSHLKQFTPSCYSHYPHFTGEKNEVEFFHFFSKWIKKVAPLPKLCYAITWHIVTHHMLQGMMIPAEMFREMCTFRRIWCRPCNFLTSSLILRKSSPHSELQVCVLFCFVVKKKKRDWVRYFFSPSNYAP